MFKNNLLLKISKVVDEDIAPIIETHGGVINIKSFENGVVTITLNGNCNNCPAAQITTEEVVKEKLLEAFPNDVKDVKLYAEVSDDIWNFAKTLLNK